MDVKEVGRYWEANAEAWTQLSRKGYDVYRDAHNTPAFLRMLPPIDGLDGLDIGCGEGANTRRLAELGARMTAIDIASTFIAHAQTLEADAPLGVAYRQADAQALPYADGSFDFATAFMSLMDTPDAGKALSEARRVLKPSGFLQFSILHPCFAPPERKVLRDDAQRPYALRLARYFDTEKCRIDEWSFSAAPAFERAAFPPFRVPYFHRTLTQWFDLIRSAELSIEALGEPMATEAEAEATPSIADTRIAPLFLHVRARRA